MKRNNKGFSLIELIVVMLIIGIVTTFVSVAVSTSNSANAKRCASSVNSLISQCRAESLGRTGTVYLTISLDSNRNIVCTHSNGSAVVTDTFPGRGTAVSYTTDNSGAKTAVTLTSSNPLTLSFNRSTGGQNYQPDGVSYCTAITFTSGRTYTITLVPSTGTHKLG